MDSDDHYATSSAVAYGKDIELRANPHQNATGYSSNIRPIIAYDVETDEEQFKATCAPDELYKTSTGVSHREPNLPNRAGWPHNDPVLRKSMPSGFQKDIPVTLPRTTELTGDYSTTTGAVFDEKPTYPQKTEPKRGKDHDLDTWREDMVKTRFSVYNKERHGYSPITGAQNFVPNLQASSRHLAASTETSSKFLGTPGHRLIALPNVIRPRGAFDPSGVSGTNSFVFSTHARPTYLTDPPTVAENQAINPQGRAGELIKQRLKKTDPCQYLNNMAGPNTTTRMLHTQQPTTRDIDVMQKSVGTRILDGAACGPKTNSGYLDNTRPTMAYEPQVAAGTAISNYTTSHSDAKNIAYGKLQNPANTTVNAANGYVRGTAVNPFGNQSEIKDLEANHPMVAQKVLMADPFVVDTTHAHKTRR